VKILVADDDAVSRRLLETTLSRAGYEVVATADGAAAASLLATKDGPRLALLDWMMPGLDGPSVCRQVRLQRETSYVYMLLLTSKETKDDVIAGLASGADDYLTKPFHPEELKARLRAGRRILELEDKLVEAREEMRFKATHDPLTQLWNHGLILDFLERELNRARREGSSLAVLLCDLDHFKSINDAHGHLVGDEVLRETARRLLAAVRPYDAVGRYGGEEFLVLLPNCDKSCARDRAEQIQAAVSERPVLTAQGPVSFTLSVGALSSSDWRQFSAEQLLTQADVALYRAKEAGRNRVVFSQPEAPPARDASPNSCSRETSKIR
jgi:diguanylate cyclase (GGDEF)-like protein